MKINTIDIIKYIQRLYYFKKLILKNSQSVCHNGEIKKKTLTYVCI